MNVLRNWIALSALAIAPLTIAADKPSSGCIHEVVNTGEATDFGFTPEEGLRIQFSKVTTPEGAVLRRAEANGVISIRDPESQQNRTISVHQVRYLDVSDETAAKRALAEELGSNRQTVSLGGYSGQDYEKAEWMQKTVEGELLQLKQQGAWIVNAGGTPDGIGKAYSIAKKIGLPTAGVVSSEGTGYLKLQDTHHVDVILIVPEAKHVWGGYLDPSKAGETLDSLHKTSRIMVAVSERMLYLGGGDVSLAELNVAHALGIPVVFHPAEANKAKAIAKWEKAVAKASETGSAIPAKPTYFYGSIGETFPKAKP